MQKAALLLLCLTTICASVAAAGSKRICPEPDEAARPIDLLIVTGGHGYEPSEFFTTFSSMPGVRYQHFWLVGTQQLSVPEGGLSQYDVILFYDLQPGEITTQWRDLLGRGRGFVFLHHAIGSFTSSPELKSIVGGHANFSKDPVGSLGPTSVHFNIRQRFIIKDPLHPVTCGVDDFDMLDEAYDNVEIDSRVHILVASAFPKKSPAVAWTWAYQNKRVLYIQPGHGSMGLPPDHGPSSYQNESFKKLLSRGIHWAAGRL